MKTPRKRTVPPRRHVLPLAHVLLERVPAGDLLEGAQNSGELLKVSILVDSRDFIQCPLIQQMFSRRLSWREAQAAAPCRCRIRKRPQGGRVVGGGLEVIVFGEFKVSCCR